jgi:hypothetical protein
MFSVDNITRSIEKAQRQDVFLSRRDHSVVDGQCRVSNSRKCTLVRAAEGDVVLPYQG